MDDDLRLLRQFRIDEAEPPPGLQARIEERLWQSILDEEADRAAGRATTRHPRWSWANLVRPAVAAGAAMSLAIAVAVVSDGGPGASAPASGSITQAGSGLFDGTASSIFGGGAPATSPIVGSINLEGDDGDETFVQGPMHDEAGNLDERSAELAQDAPRDPSELAELVRESVAAAGLDDAGDTFAYRATMRWVVDPAAPVDLRAALMRSLGELEGIDPAQPGVDVLGRRGVVVGHIDPATGVRTQAVLDPDGGTLLEVRSFTTTYYDPACPPGTFTEHALYDSGMRVDPSMQPWVDWPPVIEACGTLVSG